MASSCCNQAGTIYSSVCLISSTAVTAAQLLQGFFSSLTAFSKGIPVLACCDTRCICALLRGDPYHVGKIFQYFDGFLNPYLASQHADIS